MADEAVVPFYEKRITDKMKRAMDQVEGFKVKVAEADSPGFLIHNLDSYVEGALEASHMVRECRAFLDSLDDATSKGEPRDERALWYRDQLVTKIFRKAEHPPRSTSTISNLSAQMHLAVMADIHDELRLIGKV